MNAPQTIPPRRNMNADRAEAERLVGELYKQVTLVNETAETTTSPIALAELDALSTNLRFAADLLFAYQAGLALSTPDPVTGCFLVERIAVADGNPDTTETVLIWTQPESGLDDGPWLGYWDELGWWFIDATIATHVSHWARRPGVGQ